jgi:hypothetical protein
MMTVGADCRLQRQEKRLIGGFGNSTCDSVIRGDGESNGMPRRAVPGRGRKAGGSS